MIMTANKEGINMIKDEGLGEICKANFGDLSFSVENEGTKKKK